MLNDEFVAAERTPEKAPFSGAYSQANHETGTAGRPLVIAGGGFAGTTTLLHMILRALKDESVTEQAPLRIMMVERSASQLYGGIAYGRTPDHDYNLNLSSRRITPFAKGELPEGFPSFEDYIARKALEDPAAEKHYNNPGRQFYGGYLHHLIDLALEKAGGRVDYEARIGEVVDFVDRPDGVSLTFKDGSTVEAGHIVLATGFKEAVRPKFAFNMAARPGYLEYPYAAEGNEYFARVAAGTHNRPESRALVIGTGLSAMDSAIRLLESGYQGTITMVSRRGLMHAIYEEMDEDLRNPMAGEPREPEALAFTRQRPAFMEAVERGVDFDAVIDGLRGEMRGLLAQGYTSEEILGHWEAFVPEVYKAYPEQLASFLLDYETPINVMRVGTTPELAQKIQRAQAEGRLEIVRGKITDMRPAGSGQDAPFSVTMHATDHNGKSAGSPQTQNYELVVNGIGNSTKYDLPAAQIADPLWRNLRARDAYLVHPLRDGVKVTDDFMMYDGGGNPYRHVAVIGAPVSGHMNVTAYPYPEKEGAGARLGAFTLNIQGILGGVMALVDRQYDTIRLSQIEAPAALLAVDPRTGALPRAPS